MDISVLYKLLLLFLFITNLFAQDQLTANDSTKTDSTKIDSTLFYSKDTLGLKLKFPVNKTLPQNIITMPKPPRTPLDIDMRTSSYYTPREVQDKLDQIMNRPRSDTFMSVLAMAAFAASVAAKQLQVEKLFELKAEDYLVSDSEFDILKQLWQKAPQNIEELYLKSGQKTEQTAGLLQQRINSLADKNLIKTRGAGKNNILFFPAQNLDRVKELFKKALQDYDKSDQEIENLKSFYDKLLSINITESK